MVRPVHSFRQRRKGVQVLESLLAVIVLAAVFFAAVEYGIVQETRSTITNAAAAGAREAGKGGDIYSVRDAANAALAVNNVAIANVDTGKTVILENNAGIVGQLGDLSMTYTPPAAPVLNPGDLRVTVWIRFSALKNSGGRVVNAFDVFGFSLNNKGFQVSSLVRSEL